jgi:hypothetical protein
MTVMASVPRTALLWLAVLLTLAACSDNDSEQSEPTAPPRDDVTLEIISPRDGGTAPLPIQLQVQSSGIQIAPASQEVTGAAHYHAFIDREPVAEGEVIPSGEGIYHFTEDSIQVLRIDQGDHTIHVVLGDNQHRRITGVPAASSTFTAIVPTSPPPPTPVPATPTAEGGPTADPNSTPEAGDDDD